MLRKYLIMDSVLNRIRIKLTFDRLISRGVTAISFNSCDDKVEPPENCRLTTPSRISVMSVKKRTACQSLSLTIPRWLRDKMALLISLSPQAKSESFHPKCKQQSSVFLPSTELQRPNTVLSNRTIECEV